MKNRITWIVLLACFSPIPGYAQDVATDNFRNRLSLKAGYVGEFVMHPGFAAGIDYSLYQNKWLTLHWDSELGAYFHKWNNKALFMQTSVGSRFTTGFSLCVDLSIGMGYMLSAPAGNVYQVGKNGDLSSHGRPYHSHLKPGVSLLVGWNGKRTKDLPLIVQAGMEAYWQSHVNHSMLPHAALRVILIYKLKTR